jgi:drug/metabolite transporter (DMT)-like permease
VGAYAPREGRLAIIRRAPQREGVYRRGKDSRNDFPMLTASLPFTFAMLWASSYVAAKVGLRDITPFAFVAVRLSIAALAAYLILALRRPAWATLRCTWPHLLVGGALVHGLALATTHAALVTVGATPTALVHAFHPILTASLGVLLLGETFRWWQWLGVALGFAGVMIGVPPDTGTGALALLALSLVGLSGGTLYLKRFCPHVPPFEATTVQLAGGALLALAAMALFEAPRIEWTSSLAGAMAWNTALMSIAGMALYNFFLIRYGAARAASAFFVVPGAAALTAWLVLGETLAPQALLGLAAAAGGVALVWWRST